MNPQHNTPIKHYTSSLLKAHGSTHAYFGRLGGVSTAPFSSLNCAFKEKDDPKAVIMNRKRAIQLLCSHLVPLVTTKQVHGSTVEIVKKPWTFKNMPQADGLVTNVASLALGVLTADCVPLLLFDPKHQVIGAIHIGWRGLLAGIIPHAIDKMCGIGANQNNILAGIGPCIQQKNYEVDKFFYKQFLSATPFLQYLFKPYPTHTTKYYFNLPSAVAYILNKTSIIHIDHLHCDTYAQPDVFFSCRYALHKKHADFGCQLSTIALRD